MFLNNYDEEKKIDTIKKEIFNLKIEKFFKRVKNFTIFGKKKKEISRIYNFINFKIKNKV